MTFHTTNIQSARLWGLPAAALLALILTSPAYAGAPAPANGGKDAKVAPMLAKAGNAKVAAKAPKATAATVTAGDDKAAKKDKPFPLSASLRLDTTMGLATAIGGEQTQESVSLTIWPSLVYRLPVENLTLSASMTATIYALNDFGTAYPNGEAIAGDLYLTLGHSKVFETKDVLDGLTIAVYFRVYFPTSPSSQLYNRILTIRPFAVTTLKAGPVTIAYTFMLAKYFASTTTSSLDCANYKDGQCIEGRPQSGSFSAQVDGDQIALTGSGNNSFYVANALSLDFALVEGLSLNVSAAVYNFFGFTNYPEDQLASANAKAGRNQTDRLVFGIGLDYQVMKNFGLGISWDVDTVRPFGDDGQGLDAIDAQSSLTLKLQASI